MLVLTRLPGKEADLSRSIQALILTLAEVWASEFRRHGAPPSVYGGTIVYKPEPEDSPCEEWCDPYTVAERGWGDCDDLVIYRLAELLYQNGYKTTLDSRATLPAWPMVYRALDGSNRYHVGIRLASGAEEDPAKTLSPNGKVT